MRVLITGAAGQLGRALIASTPPGLHVTGVDLADFDIGDEDEVARAVAALYPDLIINAAAYTAVDKSESEPDLAYRVNRDAVRHLAQAALKGGAKLVHISTDFVFDGQASRPYAPDAATHPLGVYGASKLAGEQEALATGGLVIRTAWLYSAAGANFLLTMLRLFNERPLVRVVADQIGTPTSAASLALAVWGWAQANATGVHHVTDAGAASWYDFAVAIKEEGADLGLCPADVVVEPIRTEDYPTPARRPAYSVHDKTSAWSLLGGPARHWREELRMTQQELR
ncbi:MAG TPA: dTDP-4-dehydrorhamnose reductase, partial [Caulobacteraceae bacterium]|nr:dTDP-4-dehydrorhamnose reductase [Caulobacteraceae bacterium]